nr:anti-sigma factor [Ornithinimicrobium sp. HY1745]
MHALAAAYALDAVDAGERASFELHLSTCADCGREVAELREATVALSDDLTVEPPPALREQLLTQIALTPQDAPTPVDAPTDQVAPTDEVGAHRARRSRGPGRWLLAGAAAAAIAIGAVAITQWPTDTPDPAIVAVQEVLEAPDAIEATESADGATFTVVTAASLDRAVLLTEDLPGAPDGEDYQLWFVHEDGTAVSAGLMPREGDEVALEGAPAGAVAVGITVEPAGGSEQPTSDPIVAVPLQG